MRMRAIYPPPQNWQDFEELCFLLWREIWSDDLAYKHGRTGQPQHGVDIYGPQGVGIQCKGKEDYRNQAVTFDVLKCETNKAENFSPPLKQFMIATTDRRNAVLQKDVSSFSASRVASSKFSVGVQSWDDINDELNRRPRTAKFLYDTSAYSAVEWVREGLGRYKAVLRLNSEQSYVQQLFNTDTYTKLHLGTQIASSISDVITELALNAQQHGGASEIELIMTDDLIEMRDNGEAFNPLHALTNKITRLGAGLRTLENFLDTYPCIQVSRNDENQNRMFFHFQNGIEQVKRSLTTINLKIEEHFSYVGKLTKALPKEARVICVTLDGEIVPSGIPGVLRHLVQDTAPSVVIQANIAGDRKFMTSFLEENFSEEIRSGKLLLR